ncbi:MAG: hypothetical protein CMJ18_11015 [Phycisphaeraceae bacterium]|nr:hypothetical protein [Phycisphaeraceae bacterium]
MHLDDIAQHKVFKVAPDGSLDLALVLMEEHGIRHLPVVEDGSLVGMLSDRDLLCTIGGPGRGEREAPATPFPAGPTRVAHVMSRPVRHLAPEDPVARAARLMLREKISAVPLVRDGALVGLVTETDVLRCVATADRLEHDASWRFEKVEDHMTTHVFRIESGELPYAAWRLMHRKAIQHLLVVNGSDVVGIVSDRDIRGWFSGARRNGAEACEPSPTTLVRDIMTTPIRTVGSATPLANAASQMAQLKIGALPVHRSGRVVGVISETDLLKRLVSALEHTQ